MKSAIALRHPAFAGAREIGGEKAAKFRPPKVFGKMPYDRTIGRLVAAHCAHQERRYVSGRRTENIWQLWDTDISKFTHTHLTDGQVCAKFLENRADAQAEILSDLGHVPGHMPDFSKFVDARMAEAVAKKGEFRILVVGGCSGASLRELAGRSGVKLDFTVLELGTVAPDMREFAHETDAGSLHRVFPADYYDVVVSHFSLYGQRKIGLANMLHVAAPGGHVVVAGKYMHSSPEKLLLKGDGKEFGLVWCEPSCNYRNYFFHLVKY